MVFPKMVSEPRINTSSIYIQLIEEENILFSITDRILKTTVSV